VVKEGRYIKNLVSHPRQLETEWRRFRTFSRSEMSGMQFFLLRDLAQADAATDEWHGSPFTPGVIITAHKFVDDLMNDVMRQNIILIEEASLAAPLAKEEEIAKLSTQIRKSLVSGKQDNPSKLDRFVATYAAQMSPATLLSLKRLCDVRDILFHDDGLPHPHYQNQSITNKWRKGLCDLSIAVGYSESSNEEIFVRWAGLIDWADNLAREFEMALLDHSFNAIPIHALNKGIFNHDNHSSRETVENEWKKKRESLKSLIRNSGGV